MPKLNAKKGNHRKDNKAKAARKIPGPKDINDAVDKTIGEPYAWDMLDRLEKDLVVEYMRKKGFKVKSIEEIDEMF